MNNRKKVVAMSVLLTSLFTFGCSGKSNGLTSSQSSISSESETVSSSVSSETHSSGENSSSFEDRTPTIAVEKNVEMYPGTQYVLSVQSEYLDGAEIRFSSSDESVAVVSEQGRISVEDDEDLDGKEVIITVSVDRYLLVEECVVRIVREYPDTWNNATDETSVWDGVYPDEMPDSFVVNDDMRIAEINDAAALAYMNAAIEAGQSSSTAFPYRAVYLNCDVDLNGCEWKAIDDESRVLTDVRFCFQGHRISNGVLVRPDDKISSIGFFGQVNFGLNLDGVVFDAMKIGGVENQTLTSDKKWSGIVLGATDGSSTETTVRLTNVTVQNCSIAQNAAKQAILIGKAQSDYAIHLENIVLENNIVLGTYTVGGITSYSGASSIYGENVIVRNNTFYLTKAKETDQGAQFGVYTALLSGVTPPTVSETYTSLSQSGNVVYYGSAAFESSVQAGSYETDYGEFQTKIDDPDEIPLWQGSRVHDAVTVIG